VPRSIICIKLEQSSGYSENRLQLTLYSHCRLLDQKISHNFFFKNVFNMLICEIYKITLKILQETLPNFYQLLSYFLQTWKVRVCDNTPSPTTVRYTCLTLLVAGSVLRLNLHSGASAMGMQYTGFQASYSQTSEAASLPGLEESW